MASAIKVRMLTCGLTELQLYLYKSIVSRDLELINNAASTTDATLLNTVMQLQQCCCHPYLFDGIEKEQTDKHRSVALHPESGSLHHLISNSGKMRLLDKLLSKIKENDEKILLCSHLSGMSSYFEAYCNQRGLSFYSIDAKKDETITISNVQRNCDVIIHNTNNDDAFHASIGAFESITSVVLFDTDWTVKGREAELMDHVECNSEEKEEFVVYRLICKDSIDEQLCAMQQSASLSTQQLKALIRYKADVVINTQSRSTLLCDADQDINAMLQDQDQDEDSFAEEESKHLMRKEDDEKEDESVVEEARKYTLKDIMNHPENQGVIRMFVFVFAAMIVVPVSVFMVLNAFVVDQVLVGWSEYSKQNVCIVIGVVVAQLIALMYLCYAWSGEDRVPAHILDAEEEVKKEKKYDDKNSELTETAIDNDKTSSTGLRRRLK